MNANEPISLNGHPLNALVDVPDYRDRWYEPTLQRLAPVKEAPESLSILDQGEEGACTGFGLAAVLNLLLKEQRQGGLVSARMLYEMARHHDDWPGEDYEGSSCRGVIKGWFHMGVCADELWKYDPKKPGHLTLARAKDARKRTVGAYYRIRKSIVDMHAAINETGAVLCSAKVHDGWSSARGGKIRLKARDAGAHAFAVVGYTAEGFVVQNSWGPEWGKGGLAIWTYEDWMDNVMDAWVVQLALSTPQLYSRRDSPNASGAQRASLGRRGPRRDEIAGHFVHIDDGRFHDSGKYWSNLQDVKVTAKHVAESDKYDHLVVYAHGGLNSVKASACRVAAMRDTFKANRIYPYHFMYDTGLLEELQDVVFGKGSSADERAGGFTDWTDRLVERASRRAGRALWREMKAGAAAAFDGKRSPGSEVMQAFLSAFASKGATPKTIHLVGHSTGAILHAHLVQALARSAAGNAAKVRLGSVSLLAPACTNQLFADAFLTSLKKTGFGVDKLNVYALSDRLERRDSVAKVYRKSLLYMVSRAFEEDVRPPAPIAGMERHVKELMKAQHPGLEFHFSNGVASSRDRTNASTHGGFDNDRITMNDVLKVVLGKGRVAVPFTDRGLDY